jgi:hypothetical protein
MKNQNLIFEHNSRVRKEFKTALENPKNWKPGYTEIARELQISVSTAFDAIRRVQKAQLIKIKVKVTNAPLKAPVSPWQAPKGKIPGYKTQKVKSKIPPYAPEN